MKSQNDYRYPKYFAAVFLNDKDVIKNLNSDQLMEKLVDQYTCLYLCVQLNNPEMIEAICDRLRILVDEDTYTKFINS